MWIACVTLHTVALLCVVPLVAATLTASRNRHCENLAASYAARYQLAFEQGTKFRPLKMEGQPTQLVVWGEKRGPPAAAAVLLYVVLLYGLGYDATLRLQPFDTCNADGTQLLVSPAVYVAPCRNGTYNRIFDMISMDDSTPCIPLSGPMLARVSSECTHEDAFVPAYNLTKLRICASSLTLANFRKIKETLPRCDFEVSRSTVDEDLVYVVLASVDADAPSYEIDEVQNYISKNNLALKFIRFRNTSCFHQTLMYLDKANLTFLFLDKNLRMYKPELLSVLLTKHAHEDGCTSRNLNKITDLVHRIGDGAIMQKYAPQIADVVKRFQPSLYNLKEILDDQAGDTFNIENVCKWASQNNKTFESWVKNNKYEYRMYFFICTDDPLSNEYEKVIHKQAFTKHDDFDIRVHKVIHLDCYNDTNMKETFSNFIKNSPRKEEMGVIAWSSSEGIQDVAREANAEQVPLILAGPITSDTPIGSSSSAINGRLVDLAFFYRAFLNNCDWTRLAIISDKSTYAKAFTNSLFHGYNFNYVEMVVTSETIIKILTSLREDEARIFIVNTISSIATEILQAAVTLGMKPPHFGWIVREWSPTQSMAAAMTSWGDMSHFSLGTAWRGAGDGVTDSKAMSNGSDAAMRARLQALWPNASWPVLAAPLADAILLLDSSFNIFQRLYSANYYNMRHGKYTLNFSQIYDTIRLSGVDREISFRNGNVETVIVYLERWRGSARTVLGSWNLGDKRDPFRNQALCGAPIRDRPPCSFPVGGKGFIQRCYDIPLYSLLVALALLPIIFEAARRARFKRLAVRDLNLLAHILDKKQPVVHGHSLCVHRKIGMGNFGSVYLATVRQSKDKVMSVAAKELRDESDKEEYLQEVGILQQLDHENIVKFVGICVSNGSLFILMEYAHHGDLLQYLKTRRPLVMAVPCKHEGSQVSSRTLTRMACEAACALSYLARCGLVHRDVRAANCLVDARHTLKLADFGLARKLRDDLEYTSVRRTMLPVLWMAPESLSRGMFSPASDVWALGVLLLELVTLGARPYGTCAPLHVLAHVRLGGYPPIPPDSTPQMASLVLACWKHRAVERPTAGDVERYLTREPLALRPTQLPAPDIALLPALPDPLLPEYT